MTDNQFLMANNMQVMEDNKDLVIIKGVYDLKNLTRKQCEESKKNNQKRKEEILSVQIWNGQRKRKYFEFRTNSGPANWIYQRHFLSQL